MHEVQAAKLHDEQEQEKASGQAGFQEILPVLQYAYRTQRNAVVVRAK